MKTKLKHGVPLPCSAALAAAMLSSCSSPQIANHGSAVSSTANKLKARHEDWKALRRPASLNVARCNVSMQLFADEVIDDPQIPGAKLLKGRVTAWVTSHDMGRYCFTAARASYNPTTHWLHFEVLPVCESFRPRDVVMHYATDKRTFMKMNTDSLSSNTYGPSHTDIVLPSPNDSNR
jgi:hypothetical protein